jgi:hypothetical protein
MGILGTQKKENSGWLVLIDFSNPIFRPISHLSFFFNMIFYFLVLLPYFAGLNLIVKIHSSFFDIYFDYSYTTFTIWASSL